MIFVKIELPRAYKLSGAFENFKPELTYKCIKIIKKNHDF